jgi:hypothetical protein
MMRLFAGTMVAVWLTIGCGTIGPPVPPETVGVRAKMEKERAREAGQPPALPPEERSMSVSEPTGPEDAISSRPRGDAMIRSR